MPTTTTDIANRALDYIGDRSSITDLDTDTTERGVTMARLLTEASRTEQEAFVWPELVTRTTLSGTAHATLVDTYEFTIPADYVTIVGTDYRVRQEGSKLLAYNTESLQLVYQAYESDPDNWPTGLQRCVALRLAIMAAPRLTQRQELTSQLYQQLMQVVRPEAYMVEQRNRKNPKENRRDQVGRHRQSRHGTLMSSTAYKWPGFPLLP